MDNLFYAASKTIGMVARAESWMVLGLILTLYGTLRRRRGLALWASGLTLSFVLALTVWPLGDLVLEPLEARYPPNPPLTRVDGIIVLGGAEHTGPYRRWGTPQFNEAGERIMAAVTLAARFPGARLIFTGGEGALQLRPGIAETATLTRQAFVDLGVAPDRITLEGASRNTAENARLTLDLVQPQPDQVFVLVTSAFHMTRAMQSFETAGWRGVVAWPVDFRTGIPGNRLTWRMDDHLADLDIALKEHLGLLVYGLTGR